MSDLEKLQAQLNRMEHRQVLVAQGVQALMLWAFEYTTIPGVQDRMLDLIDCITPATEPVITKPERG